MISTPEVVVSWCSIKKIRFFKNHIKKFVLEPLFINNKVAGLQPATLLKSDLSAGIFLFLRTSLGEPLYI